MKKIQQFNKKETLKQGLYMVSSVILFSGIFLEPAYAEYFDTKAVKEHVVDKGFDFVDSIIPFIALGFGGLATMLAPGGTLIQKGMLLAGGASVVGMAIPISKYMLGIE